MVIIMKKDIFTMEEILYLLKSPTISFHTLSGNRLGTLIWDMHKQKDVIIPIDNPTVITESFFHDMNLGHIIPLLDTESDINDYNTKSFSIIQDTEIVNWNTIKWNLTDIPQLTIIYNNNNDNLSDEYYFKFYYELYDNYAEVNDFCKIDDMKYKYVSRRAIPHDWKLSILGHWGYLRYSPFTNNLQYEIYQSHNQLSY